MADALNASAESWRTPRRPSLVDGQVKRMGLIAAAVAALAALGFGGYALVGRGPRVVPVIEADSRPLRVKPANPGGMQVAGAEEQIMGGTGSGQADALAPAPEAPAPQMLRAQIRAAQQPDPAPAPPAPAQTVSLAVPPPAEPSPVSALPERRPVSPAARPAAPRPDAAAPAPATGGTQVQLAAVESEQAAMAEWQRLAKRMPDLLGPRRPAVQRAERDGKTFFRLRTGGFTDIAAATAFCTQVKSKGGGCSIASF